MTSNLPMLVRNTLDGFGDGAQHLYLALLDKHPGWADRDGELRAFAEADRYEARVGAVLDHILVHASTIPNGPWKSDLKRFFADRYRHNFIGAVA